MRTAKIKAVAWAAACTLVAGMAVVGCGAARRARTAPESAAPREVQAMVETPQQKDARMEWWRGARFGLFIHWGLYAIPAGEWRGQTNHAEWIRHTAQIPVAEYDKLTAQFNPVKFDADAWVRMAKDAGMRYIVITSKHHDGFCLFDSQLTDFDVLSTPFQRDILAELAAACRRHGVRLCFYHSIMDWHHPDYLPRREWEAADRPAAGADLDRYITHMKGQLRELVTKYGPLGVLWFDGEWESTWTHERGVDLYNYVRGLQPDIIVNNRVDTGRSGMAGLTRGPGFVGDFGTPEQEVPPTGLPGVDWESCITMNDHWGWNKHDRNWKSAADLVRMLCDIASKGGNLLLNVGPTAEGEFPPEAVERLAAIGKWMRVHGEAIYGTRAGPFGRLAWGRCTQKPLPGGTRLYLFVFDWPADGRLVVPGLLSPPRKAELLAAEAGIVLPVRPGEDALVVELPARPDVLVPVIALDVTGPPDVAEPPAIAADEPIFVESLEVRITTPQPNVELRYTLDGKPPTPDSPRVAGPVKLTDTATVRVRAFRGGRPVSPVAETTFRRVAPRPALDPGATAPGLLCEYYEGDWDRLPPFDGLMPVRRMVVPDATLPAERSEERFAIRLRGFVRVPATGIYRFYTTSDDGSRLYIADQLVVDNDGLHGAAEASGVIALAAGLHPLTLTFFEKTGQQALEIGYSGPGLEKRRVPAADLVHVVAER